jgi:hypothetical protein
VADRYERTVGAVDGSGSLRAANRRVHPHVL